MMSAQTVTPEEFSAASATAAVNLQGGNDTATVYLDSALRIRSVNRAFEERYGLSHGTLEGRLFLQADGARWHHPELYALLQRVADSVAGAQPDSCTFILPAGTVDGSGTPFRAQARRMNGSQSSRSGLICLSLEELPPLPSEPSEPSHTARIGNEARIASLCTELRYALQVMGGTTVLLSHTTDPQTRADVGALNAQLPRLQRICADLERYASGGSQPHRG